MAHFEDKDKKEKKNQRVWRHVRGNWLIWAHGWAWRNMTFQYGS